MDEISMVRRLLDEPPPAPHVVAEGRRRLVGTRASAAATPHMTRRAVVRSALALSLTTAAAAAVVVMAMLIPGASTSPSGVGTHTEGGKSPLGAGGPSTGGGRTSPVNGRTSPGTNASARSVLLAAAVRAESAPTTGTYWHVRSMSESTLQHTFGQGDDRYTLEQLSVQEKWATRDGQGWQGERSWVRPKTPADEAAWRRDGAPSKLCTGMTDTDPPRPICFHTAPGTASLVRDYFAFEVNEGHETETFAQLQQLPSDPDQLLHWLIADNKRELDPSAGPDIINGNVAQELAGIIEYLPVSPDVRAAAFRALAEMPNVTSLGPTQDKLGRPGIGIEIALGKGYVVRPDGVMCGHCPPETTGDELIIDPATSNVLAEEILNSDSGTLYLEVGWTDQKPHKPAFP